MVVTITIEQILLSKASQRHYVKPRIPSRNNKKKIIFLLVIFDQFFYASKPDLKLFEIVVHLENFAVLPAVKWRMLCCQARCLIELPVVYRLGHFFPPMESIVEQDFR